MVEHDRDRRWLTTWQCDLSDPGRNKVIFDLAEDDDYADPGSPMMRLHPDGTRTVRQDGTAIFLRVTAPRRRANGRSLTAVTW